MQAERSGFLRQILAFILLESIVCYFISWHIIIIQAEGSGFLRQILAFILLDSIVTYFISLHIFEISLAYLWLGSLKL